MSQISPLGGFSLNPLKSHEYKKRYEKHVQTIVGIASKKPNIKEISSEQEKITNILKRSKQMAKEFRQHQFKMKREEENKRLMKSISVINSRQKLKTQQSQARLSAKNQKSKEKRLKQFEIERENLILAHNLLKNSCDASKYKKKIEKEIGEYLRIKNNMQRLKPISANKQKKFAHLDWKQAESSKPPRLKTSENDSKAFQTENSSLQKRRETERVGRVD